jgi:serine/threonine protein kinase/peptidoglycan hydrolase-like protein with peptidoglycan-binding domain
LAHVLTQHHAGRNAITPLNDRPHRTTATPQGKHHMPHATHTIGRFQLLKRLGGGGFGEVFLAQDPTIERQVAIKVFRPKDENLIAFATSSDEEGLQILRSRFLNEAKILAALDDEPHVVNVLEFGELPDGTPYYAMPYLPVSLATELGRDVFDVSALEELPQDERPRALPLDRALDAIEQTLTGLAAAHHRGLIHRDIKPGNLMRSEKGVLRIVDFGIAKAPDTSHSTVSHLGLGSRNYMAPEQRESAKHVDARADVYAVGVVAYRALTGKLPIGRFADPNVALPALGTAMNALLLKMLSQDKADRPADAAEALAAFQQARKSVGQANSSDTATWSGDGEAGIRDDLKPLRARIAEILHATGLVLTTEREGLRAMAAIADLDEAALDRLIVETRKADNTLTGKHRLATLLNERVRQKNGPLGADLMAHYQTAAAPLGWDRPALERLVARLIAELTPAQDVATGKTPRSVSRPSTTPSETTSGKGRLIGIASVLLVLIGAGAGIYHWRQGQMADAASKQAALQTTPTTTAPISPTTTPVPSSTDPQRTRLLTIQDYLNRLGYRIAETGEADPRTVEAIKRFEQEHKLIVTGTPDELVQTELVKEYDRRDAEAWAKATKTHTEAAYLDYRETFPQGAHIGEVDSQRDAAAWAQARKQDTEAAYQRYRDNYPQGAQASEVDRRIAAAQERVAEEKRLAEEKGMAEEKRKAEEAARLEEEKRIAEEKRKTEEQKIAEETRIAEEKRLTEERLAEEIRKAEEAELVRNGGFRDNGDGTLTDSKTGLLWTRYDNGEKLDVKSAELYCVTKGMRLPTIQELMGIYHRGESSCGKEKCLVSPLFSLSMRYFISSTSTGNNKYETFHFTDGWRSTCKADDGMWGKCSAVLCVRG